MMCLGRLRERERERERCFGEYVSKLEVERFRLSAFGVGVSLMIGSRIARGVCEDEKHERCSSLYSDIRESSNPTQSGAIPILGAMS